MCGLASYPPGFAAAKFHADEEHWNLSYTLSGSVHEELIQGETTQRAHDFMVLKPGGSHRWSVPLENREPWRVVWFVFVPKPEWMPLLDLPEEYPRFSRIPLAGRKYDAKIRRALLQANWLATSPIGSDALIMNALERALLWVHADQSEKRGRLDLRVQSTMEMFARRLANPPSIPEAAAACGLSPSRLDGLFRAEVGQSPQQWLEHLRLSHARDLLLSTSLPIKLIAIAVGYSDQRHFATRFLKFFRQTPSQYREKESPARS